jgi:hypothetical protein
MNLKQLMVSQPIGLVKKRPLGPLPTRNNLKLLLVTQSPKIRRSSANVFPTRNYAGRSAQVALRIGLSSKTLVLGTLDDPKWGQKHDLIFDRAILNEVCWVLKEMS